jgi:hypothetical protein
MDMTLECRSFTVTPLSDGKVRLEIVDGRSAASEDQRYDSNGAAKRLAEILNIPVSPSTLAYWRGKGLPHRRLGPKKFIYTEKEMSDWAKGHQSSMW